MALIIPSYPNQYSTNPWINAYAWIMMLACNFAENKGVLKFAVHPDAASARAGLKPIDTPEIVTGQSWYDGAADGSPQYTFPSMDQIVADNLVHFQAISAYLYDELQKVPNFAGSSMAQ